MSLLSSPLRFFINESITKKIFNCKIGLVPEALEKCIYVNIDFLFFYWISMRFWQPNFWECESQIQNNIYFIYLFFLSRQKTLLFYAFILLCSVEHRWPWSRSSHPNSLLNRSKSSSSSALSCALYATPTLYYLWDLAMVWIPPPPPPHISLPPWKYFGFCRFFRTKNHFHMTKISDPILPKNSKYQF